jgi:hypothetical protein
VVDGTKGCWTKFNGEFALERIQSQIEWKAYTSRLNLKRWTRTFELLPIRQTSGDKKVCENLWVITYPHPDEGRVYARGDFPAWLVALGLQCHIIKKWGSRNLSKDDESWMHGRWHHA